MKLQTQFVTHPLYRISQLVFAAFMLTFLVFYWFANREWEDCADTTKTQLAALQTRLDNNKARDDALKARAAALAEAAEKAKQGGN